MKRSVYSVKQLLASDASTSSTSGNNSHCDGPIILQFAETVSCMFSKTQTLSSSDNLIVVTDEYINLALTYLYRKATNEVIHFYSKSKVERLGVVKDGILFSRTRIIDGMNFEQTEGLEVNALSNLGIKAFTPVLDRFSPLAYCIARHVHWNLATHRGVETCHRTSLEHVTILQGANLFKELSEECIRCKVTRKKYIDAPMGLVSDHQLRVCPPFWAAQVDLFGPVQVYVPGFQKNTRNRSLQAECHVIVFACPVTRLLNLQVIEKKDGSGIIDGVTRLACEVGVPKVLLMDQDAAFMKAVSELEFTFKDAQLKLHRELGLEFITCPVAGHSQHGQVERRIRSVQQSLEQAGLKKLKIHATGLQTLLKLTENQLNNMPLGYSYGRDSDNTSLLKMITPDMLRVGRNNSRALDGPMRLPKGGELLEKVQETYYSWFWIWASTYIPKIMFQPKWWNHDKDLKENDLVLFKKKDSVLETEWTMGVIDELIPGRDGVSRRAIVKYQNTGEDRKRTTDRSVRSLVKLWSIDDQDFNEDLVALEKNLRNSANGALLLANPAGELANLVDVRGYGSVGGSCCMGHLRLSGSLGEVAVGEDLPQVGVQCEAVLPSCLVVDLHPMDLCDDEEDDLPCKHSLGLSALLSSLELDLS